MTTITFFSDQQPADLREKIRRIPSFSGPNGFVSQPYFLSKDTKTPMIEWIQATRTHHRDDRWTLKKITQSGNDVRQTHTIMTGLCFFDALYFCLREQSTREKSEYQKYDQSLENLHIRNATAEDAAKACHQPLDFENLPLPALQGEILTDGIYHPSAEIIAQKTTEICPLQERTEHEHVKARTTFLAETPVTAFMERSQPSAEGVAIDKASQRERIIRQFESSSKRSKSLVETAILKINGQGRDIWQLSSDKTWRSSIEKRTDINMKILNAVAVHSIGFVIALIPAAALNMPLLLLSGPVLFGSGVQATKWWFGYENEMRKLALAINSIPDEEKEYKSLLKDFHKAVRANVYFGRAAHISEKHSSLSRFQMNRGMSYIRKGAKLLNFSDTQTNALKEEFSKRNFPGTEVFKNKIYDMYNDIIRYRDNRCRTLLTADGANSDHISRSREKWVRTL